jgi:hypothetical protein
VNLTTSAVARQAAPDLDEEVVHLVTGGYTHEKNADYWQTRPWGYGSPGDWHRGPRGYRRIQRDGRGG